MPENELASVLDLVRAHALDDPDRPAVEDAAGTVTYAGLWDLAQVWADRIRRHGVGPDRPVAVAVRRSRHLVALQLGAWLADAAYVAVDPAVPTERLRTILDKAGCAAVARATLPGTEPVLEPGPAAADPVPPRPGTAAAGDPAYVVFTSGSTGEPKGVQVSHRNLANLIHWYLPAFGLSARDRVAAFMGTGFDASVLEIWTTLGVGATLVLPDDDEGRSVETITAVISEGRITKCFVATVLAEQLFRTFAAPSTLRVLITGGDRLRQWPPANFPAAVHNVYGPTEATVLTTTSVDLRTLPPEGLPPIGNPVGGAVVRLVGPDGTIVTEAGTVGELWAGGEIVALGYVGAERDSPAFLTDGVAGPGRWYRTGDNCHWRPDGQLQFVGRVDRQVKVRGHRIELGEIEQVIGRVPGVIQCAVVVAGADDSPHLVAFVAGRFDETLRDEMARYLPASMLPRRIMPVEALPLTLNGKIDYAELATLAEQEADQAAPVPPDAVFGSDVERDIAQIWSRILREPVTAGDDFFVLGGHSLLAAEMVSEVRRRFGISLHIRTLLRSPSLGDFAAEVDKLVRTA